MENLPRYDMQTLCPDYRFIRVVSQKGVYYEVVQKWQVRPHAFALEQQSLSAKSVNRTSVPPCIFRDCTALDGTVRTCVWKDGTTKLFPIE